MLFNLEVSQQEGGGASVFSRAAAQLEYATTSALNITQRAASWLARRALRLTSRWATRLNDDETVSISVLARCTLFGGISTSVFNDFVGGKVAFSHGGLELMYFVADPAQPLDLRATFIRIASAKTGGEFDRQVPLVISHTWGGGNFHFLCKMLCVDSRGEKITSEEDVSQLLEKLKISPGGGSHQRRHRHNLCWTI